MSLIEHFLSGEQNDLACFSVIWVDLGGAGQHAQWRDLRDQPIAAVNSDVKPKHPGVYSGDSQGNPKPGSV